MNKLTISPRTKVGELLEAYPKLEEVLMGMSPAFHKLRNPILRKTVAKVATLQQISIVGGIPIEIIISRLRAEAGQDDTTEAEPYATQSEVTELPSWVDESRIVLRYDASPVISAGESPMGEVLKKANSLGYNQIFELKTPFIPAPIIEILKSKKFLTVSIKKGSSVYSYITPSL